MAVVDLNPQAAGGAAGIAATYRTAISTSDNYRFPNDGRVLVIVKNASGSALTVTIATPKTIEGLAVADRTVSVAGNGDHVIDRLDPDLYNDANGEVDISFSATTCSFALIQL